jgi:hypothetical protein
MATDPSFAAYVLDQAAEAGDVRARRMFGEYALYHRGGGMAAPKTVPHDTPVLEHLAANGDAERHADCQGLIELMSRVTGCEPVMWGRSIVGFDRYHYRYASGHEGDAAVVGFASGRRQLTLYLAPGFTEADGPRALLSRLGRHTTGKGCLYVKRLADVDMAALESLVAWSVEEIARRHPAP